MLDGQGADETLAGYHAYYHSYFDNLRKKYPSSLKKEYEAYKILHASNDINALMDKNALYYVKQIVSPRVYHHFKKKYVQYKQTKKFFTPAYAEGNNKSYKSVKEDFNELNQALHYSTFSYGLEDLLRYADRNAMAHGVEVRLPFLQHELVEFLFTLPPQMKIHEGWTKWLQRHAFETELPHDLRWRKDKIGYEPPQKSWMENKVLKKEIMDHTQHLISQHIFHDGVARNVKSLTQDEQWRILMIGRMVD